jgi:hypothetical protein
LKTTPASEKMYTEVSQLVSERFPEFEPVSHFRVENALKNLTDVTSSNRTCVQTGAVLLSLGLSRTWTTALFAVRHDGIRLNSRSPRLKTVGTRLSNLKLYPI